jgi:chlorite dismutase
MPHPPAAGASPLIELSERGAVRDGQPQLLDRRLFVQLIALEAPRQPSVERITSELARSLDERKVGSVLYADLHHPLGFAVVAWAEDPRVLAGALRSTINAPELPDGLRVRPELSMLGRTYSTGYESDLQDFLLERPKRTLLNPKSEFAVFYPLRRKGGFERLDPREKGAILSEHGAIGRAYGEQDLAHDIRLCCHGLDPNDNDFVVGLVGKELYPLSHVVQGMRKTRQTAEHMEKMGPFFVGQAIHRNAHP